MPYVVKEARSIDKGKTSGTNLGEKYIKNLPIVKMSNPFPASSSIYNQKVCIIKIRKHIAKTAMNLLR